MKIQQPPDHYRHLGTNLAALSQHELNSITERLNYNPRKTLNWMISNEACAEQVESLNVVLEI